MLKDVNLKKNEFGKNIFILSIILSIISFIIITIVFIIYLSNFNGGFSKESSDWGNMGDFIGGILSPILSFLSTILIVVSIIISIISVNDNRKQQNIERLYSIIFKIEEEIDKHNYPASIPDYNGPKNPRPPDEFTTLQLANMYKLLYHWLNRIVIIDKYDALAIHITEKHHASVREINEKKWFLAVGDKNNEIYDFFNKQSARLFRDDI